MTPKRKGNHGYQKLPNYREKTKTIHLSGQPYVENSALMASTQLNVKPLHCSNKPQHPARHQNLPPCSSTKKIAAQNWQLYGLGCEGLCLMRCVLAMWGGHYIQALF